MHRGRDRALLEDPAGFSASSRPTANGLKRLTSKVRDSNGELDSFVVDLPRRDADRHIAVLRFIEHLVRRSPLG